MPSPTRSFRCRMWDCKMSFAKSNKLSITSGFEIEHHYTIAK
jgi:hypothetical protein